MHGGEIFIPKIPSALITDLSTSLAPDLPQRIVGIRPGEKIHEELTSKNEILKPTEDPDIFYVVPKKNHNPKPINFDVFKNISPTQKAAEIKLLLKTSI